MSTRRQRPPGGARARGSCSIDLRCPAALGTCAGSACGPGHRAAAPVASWFASPLGGRALRRRRSRG
eukprot:2306513-Alexandrium_andersonii.AAC.1